MYEARILKIQVEKGVVIVGHDRIKKLALFNFIMVTQASDFCFSFYNALDTSSKKKKYQGRRKVEKNSPAKLENVYSTEWDVFYVLAHGFMYLITQKVR